jgi:hypothetical protein
MKLINLAPKGVGVDLNGEVCYFGGRPEVNAHAARVEADGGTVPDGYEVLLTELVNAVNFAQPSIKLLWAASASKEAVDYSVLPADGSGDFTYSGGGNAVSQRPDGTWQINWPANTPRNRYDNGVLGRLIEPQRQNLISYPRLFSNAAWTTAGELTGGQAGIFVDASGANTNEAFKFKALNANEQLKRTTAFTTVAATTYTNSIYIKRVTGTGQVSIIDVNNTARAVTVTSDWTKVEYAAAASGTSGQIGIQLATAGDEVMICHAQPEAGTKSTSPIYGTEGSLLTRNADAISKTGASALIGQTEGSIAFEFDAGSGFDLYVNSLSATGLTGSVKGCFVYTTTAIKLFVNGALVDSETGTYDWSSMDNIELGNYNGVSQLNGSVRELIKIKTAISDEAAIQLTA